MYNYENLLVSIEAKIATVTVNRPKVLNALNKDTLLEIKSAFTALATDPAVKVIILTGAGEKAFVAGADIAFIFRPMQAFTQGVVDAGERERGVAAIPAEHVQGRLVIRVLVKMREGDFAVVRAVLSEGGDKQQILGMPGRGSGFVGRGALLDDKVREDAAQDDDRQFLVFEFDEENAPRLAADQRTQLMNGLDVGGIFFLQAQFGGAVFEGEFVEAVFP